MAQTPSFRDEWYRLRRPAAVYVLLLGIMEGYAEHIADALITGAEAEDKGGVRARVARWSLLGCSPPSRC
jgi:hypothetical protein